MSSFTLTFCPTQGVYSIPMDEYESIRVFAVDSSGTTVFCEMSPSVSRALDVLASDGATMEKWLPVLLAAEEGGKDPLALAEHVINLRASLRPQYHP